MAIKKGDYFHWIAIQTTTDDLEDTLNQAELAGYDVQKMISIGEEEVSDVETADVMVVVCRTKTGVGKAGKDELQAILDAEDDEDEDEDEDE